MVNYKIKRFFVHNIGKEEKDTATEGLFSCDGRPQILYYCKAEEEIFLFDEKGGKLFNSQFKAEGYKLLRKITPSGSYLIRENLLDGIEESFHRWLMKEEIDKFCLEKNYSDKEVVVHHKDFDTLNNQIENLQIITRRDHNIIHNRQENFGEEDKEPVLEVLKKRRKLMEEGLDPEATQEDYDRLCEILEELEKK